MTATVLGQWFDPFGFSAFFCLLVPILVIAWILIGVLVAMWIYKDANRRGENGTFWGLLVGILWVVLWIGSVITIVIWLATRKPDILCDDRGNPLPGREAQYAAYNRTLNIGEKRMVAGAATGAGWTSTRPAPGAPVPGARAARSTCPSCGRVFDYVPAASGPTDVKCPSCGTEGSI